MDKALDSLLRPKSIAVVGASATPGKIGFTVIRNLIDSKYKGKIYPINPGATDTGWMSDDLMAEVRQVTLAGRVGMPQDCANLVRFLCSKEGGWVNAQLLYSNGGLV